MKKIILSLVLAASVLTGCKGEKKAAVETEKAKVVDVNVSELDNVNIAESVLTWKGTKPGGAHNGDVAIQKGGLLVENGVLIGGQFTFDMTSIKVLDIPADEEGNGKLVGHLSSPDFFDVTTYPGSKFTITKVEGKNGKVDITGNLTVKDVTKSITIPATIMMEDGITTLKSDNFNINRAEFNIQYKSKSFFSIEELKDKFIDDLIEMSFVVKTKA
ncbi:MULTISPECIES: YceI family protein [unclassified Polaribacter]|uniref:YceI family protein n=1 Tax=unclassified Polaribacter TaxID=196858 RepID=UPI0011BFAF3F|nr:MULTISPECIES: YceI family protein [unclassified Polaribacter]TXD51121.1 YceI family protein [Polaribacter sp. IC063]TXD58182.1 YceI family protein [Polaribacter sp. IC066]